MTVNDLLRLYDYGYWANRRLLPAISRLTPEQFCREVTGGHGSIRDILVHVLSAEWGWLDRCGGPKRGPALSPSDYPTVEELAEACRTVEGHVRGFLASLRDGDLARSIEFTNPRGEKRSSLLGYLLHHAANHGVHHRGQVALLLRMLGQPPGNIDLLFYDAEKSGGSMAW